ncbi:MAG: M23 family metallopeptidase [Alphaproteobacteria bacterium]|nr:M23 family metallopeptidase [Alphaproteobacteria bacterium]
MAIVGLALIVAGCARWYDDRESASGSRTTAGQRTQGDGGFVPVPPPGARQIPVPASGVHTVVRGNTVYSISRLYGVPVRSIIESNGLKPPYLLKVGDRLRLSAPRTHRVARGDTVYSISRRYDVQMSELMRVNGIQPPYTIVVDQDLSIPAGGSGHSNQVARASPAAAPAPTPRPASRQATPSQVAALPSPPPRTGRLFLWPVKGEMIAKFGSQPGGRHNDGINIGARRGDTVVAAESGVVAYAGNELRGFGNLLLIKHADGFMTAYAHNDALLVKRGQKVRKGDAIARVGSSGSVGKPQLHFEIRKGRKAVDPLGYLPKRAASS